MLGQRFLMQGASGAGKSRAMRLMYERLPSAYQQIIVDVDAEFHTLRRPGHDYIILGGAYEDAPGLIDMDWRSLATVVLKMGANIIFQIDEWSLDDQREFVAEFFAGLLSAPQDLWRPLIVGLDETDLFAPNGPTVASSNAVFDLAKRGRKRGFSAFYATQRMASLSADVRGQCENILIGRVNQGLDQRAAAEALGLAPRSAEVLAMKTFKQGQFWISGPSLNGGDIVCARLDLSETAAPKPGSAVPPSAAPAAVLKALAKLPKKEAPPAPEASQASPQAHGTAAPQVVFRDDPAALERARAAGEAEGVTKGWGQCWKAIMDALALVYQPEAEPAPPARVNGAGGDRERSPKPPKPGNFAPHQPSHPIPSDPTLSPPSLVVLKAFVDAYPRPLTFRMAALSAGRSPKSSNQKTVERELPACGQLVEATPGKWTLTPAAATRYGVEHITRNEPAGVVEKWKSKLPDVQARLLDAIWQHGYFPSRERWAEEAGVSPKSSNMKSGPAELASLDLVTLYEDGGATLHEDLQTRQ